MRDVYMILLQVPDFVNARIGGLPAYDVIRDIKWFREQFTPTVSPAVTVQE